MTWNRIETAPLNKAVWTKIEDYQGTSNLCKLLFDGKLWWTPEKDMYVYYQPTHWSY